MRSAGWMLSAALAGGACEGHEPPTPPGSPSVAVPEFLLPEAGGAEPAPDAPGPEAAPGDETRDRPRASGRAFEERVAGLWAGIVKDDADLAMSFFFPLAAYERVKDVGDPAADWQRRLVSAYRRDIHELHEQLGRGSGAARLLGLEVPEARARWVLPGEEYNKLGYYRVYCSRLRFAVEDRTESFEVKSLISWRGQWFVVHLHAIK